MNVGQGGPDDLPPPLIGRMSANSPMQILAGSLWIDASSERPGRASHTQARRSRAAQAVLLDEAKSLHKTRFTNTSGDRSLA